MADLQVCYFCGSGPGSSLGEYAVVPPALEPTDEQQRSVVLCQDCRGKLTTVMEPVVTAAEAATGGGSDGPVGGVGPDPEPPADPGSADAGQESPADAAAGDDAEEAGRGSRSADEGDDGGVSVPPASAGGDEDAGVAVDPDGAGPPEAGDREPEVDPGEDDGDEGAASEAPDDDGGDAPPPDSNAPRDQPHTDDELVGRNNEAYNKTLRLLQNREFPVERHEIEQVAANAYQLDPQEVSDAIDALIQKGLLSQEGAQLMRP